MRRLEKQVKVQFTANIYVSNKMELGVEVREGVWMFQPVAHADRKNINKIGKESKKK